MTFDPTGFTLTVDDPRAAGGHSAGRRAPDHERVVVEKDSATGLCLIVAIHSTALGPALGGMRLRSYSGGLGEALGDALALARTMTLKASAAGLDFGGGKSVVVDDGRMPPGSDLRARRFAAAARVVARLDGAYVTAEDIGTTMDDMDLMARHTDHVVGCSPQAGGAGDPSPVTAEGVARAIGRGLREATGSAELAGRSAGIVGLGKVGGCLAGILTEAGAKVSAYDVDPGRLERAADALGVEPAPSLEALAHAPVDVLCPCAAGGMIDAALASELSAAVICGAANNPLADGAAEVLARRGVVSVPDFLANCGGLIHVAADRNGYDRALVDTGLERAMARLDEAFAAASDGSVTPAAAAEAQALARVAGARARAAAA
jgi:glutamate dehydrogenase/leucine dehydrogenase